MDLIPNIGIIYNKVRQDKKQQGINNMEVFATYVTQSNSSSNHVQESGQNGNQDMNNLFYHHCKINGHTKETCYKIHGYPPGYKPIRNPENSNNKINVNHGDVTNNDNVGSTNKNDTEDIQYQISALKNQVDKFNAMFSASTINNSHMADIICLTFMSTCKND